MGRHSRRRDNWWARVLAWFEQPEPFKPEDYVEVGRPR